MDGVTEPNPRPVIVLGQYQFHPDDVEPAAALLRAMTEATLREPGCVHYAFGADVRTPHLFQLSELWQDDAALQAHFATPHMAAFRSGLAKLRVERRSVRKFEVSGGGEL